MRGMRRPPRASTRRRARPAHGWTAFGVTSWGMDRVQDLDRRGRYARSPDGVDQTNVRRVRQRTRARVFLMRGRSERPGVERVELRVIRGRRRLRELRTLGGAAGGLVQALLGHAQVAQAAGAG